MVSTKICLIVRSKSVQSSEFRLHNGKMFIRHIFKKPLPTFCCHVALFAILELLAMSNYSCFRSEFGRCNIMILLTYAAATFKLADINA